MNEREFTVNGRNFKLSKLDTFKQFHVVRRLGPIIGDVIPVATRLKDLDKEGLSEEEKFEKIGVLIQPLMNGLARLTDADADFVLLNLCMAVEVQQQPIGNWARVATPGAGMAINDLDLPTLLQVAARAFAFHLSGFFALAPQASPGGR